MPKDIAKLLLKDGKKTTVLTDDFARRLVNEIKRFFDIRVRLKSGKTCDVIYGDSLIDITIPASESTGETTTGGTYRGLWVTGGTSNYQERWKVASGAYAGMYVCINPDGTSRNPWEGVDWHQESSAVGQIGSWT